MLHALAGVCTLGIHQRFVQFTFICHVSPYIARDRTKFLFEFLKPYGAITRWILDFQSYDFSVYCYFNSEGLQCSSEHGSWGPFNFYFHFFHCEIRNLMPDYTYCHLNGLRSPCNVLSPSLFTKNEKDLSRWRICKITWRQSCASFQVLEILLEASLSDKHDGIYRLRLLFHERLFSVLEDHWSALWLCWNSSI